MKVFIYDKSTSKRIRVINNAQQMYESGNLIVICTQRKTYAYQMKTVKTTCYQN